MYLFIEWKVLTQLFGKQFYFLLCLFTICSLKFVKKNKNKQDLYLERSGFSLLDRLYVVAEILLIYTGSERLREL